MPSNPYDLGSHAGPTGPVHPDNIIPNARLMGSDGRRVDISYVIASSPISVGGVEVYLKRQLEDSIGCCDDTYTGAPYELRLRLPRTESLRLANGSFVKVLDSLGAELWVVDDILYRIISKIDIPSYWYAALLAGGCLNGSDPPTIETPSPAHWSVMDSYNTNSYRINRTPTTVGGSTYSFTSYKSFGGISEMFLDLGNLESTRVDWYHAFVPDNYRYGITQDRIAFVQGLMDYRGWVDEKGNANILIKSESLHNSLHWLVRSLGGWTTSQRVPNCDETNVGWKMTIYLPRYIYPFGVPRDGYIPTMVTIPPWRVIEVLESPIEVFKSISTTSGDYMYLPDVIARS